MEVWDVLGKRTDDDELEVVGGVNAPDRALALLLAHEAYFRHREGVGFAVRRRGDGAVHVYDGGAPLGGVTDRSYRRQDGYVGVGAKLKRVREEMRRRGVVVDRPRPPGRGRDADAGRDAGRDSDDG
ncbi:MAG TPA: hypothetical protein VEO00_05715 [Actinomycetota bacterium]|nr:hypothetical protein [Actinomycetota bacterium]